MPNPMLMQRTAPPTPAAPAAPIVQAPEQPAQQLSIPITADQATVLETARLNTLGPDKKPLYPDLSSFVAAHSGIKNVIRQLARQFPPASLRAKQELAAAALATAQQAATEAADAALAIAP